MQVVLSEINCYNSLVKYGVHPDEFYTDFESFKSRATFFTDAVVLIIYAGNCRFNKKVTLELIKNLMKRAENKNDGGIKAVYVISDMSIASLNKYYKYEGSIATVNIMRGWKSVANNVNIWINLASPQKETKFYLSEFDRNDFSEALKRYESRGNAEDEYIPLIQVPNVKKILGLS